MKNILDLNFGFSDAENYRKRENKELFNKIFIIDHSLERLLSNNTHFLIGEKGTGKTAYSVYLVNNHYKETIAELKYIRETEYSKFVKMKKEKHLELSDYSSIWKVIVLLLLSKSITGAEINANPFSKSNKLKSIWRAIDEFYMNAFSPEISTAMRFVDEHSLSAEMILKYLKVGGKEVVREERDEKRFQVHLLFIEKQFMDALSGIKLKNDHLLLIDGVDIRPGGIEYQDYLNCIKGLADAIWTLNIDFFSNIKDSKGRLRVVLLLRPDIYNSLGLQNSINKLKDNSVYLDWRTTYPNYRESKIFQVSDKILSAQQDESVDFGECWNHYFNWLTSNLLSNLGPNTSFISFLRHTYSRPRDILSAMQIMQDVAKERKLINKNTFTIKDFNDYQFRNRFSEYLLAGIKDQLSFYYDTSDYSAFMAFFSFLKGKNQFNYQEYGDAYDQFTDYVCDHLDDVPVFVDTKEQFLQFLYDSNVLCYTEDGEYEKLFRWCYRERTLSNIQPKVQVESNYKIHAGLEKALNVGYQRIK